MNDANSTLKGLRGKRAPLTFSGLVKSGKITPDADPSQQQEFPSTMSDKPLHVAVSFPVAGYTIPESVNTQTNQAQAADWEMIDDVTVEADIDLIDDSPYQPASEACDRYASDSIDDLAHTMAANGLQEPLLARRVGHRFELIAGHRRIRAARTLGWRHIILRVVNKTDREAEQSVMVHNEGRKDLCDYAKAKVYQRAKLKGYAKTQDDIAHMFATQQSAVSMRMAMLSLPTPIIDQLEKRNDLFSMNTALAINQLVKEHPAEIDLITKAVERINTEGAAESSVKSWVSQMLQARSRTTKLRNNKPKVITDLTGCQLYTARLEGRIITVRLSAPDMDANAEFDKLVDLLKSAGNHK